MVNFLKPLVYFFRSVLLIWSLKVRLEFYVASNTGLRDAFLQISSLWYFSHILQYSKPLAGKWSSLGVLDFYAVVQFYLTEIFRKKVVREKTKKKITRIFSTIFGQQELLFLFLLAKETSFLWGFKYLCCSHQSCVLLWQLLSSGQCC